MDEKEANVLNKTTIVMYGIISIAVTALLRVLEPNIFGWAGVQADFYGFALSGFSIWIVSMLTTGILLYFVRRANR